MNPGFYLTELAIENDPNSKIIESKELEEINDNFCLTDISTKKDNKLLEKTKHNILDYLIKEESDFADLYKVEKHFKDIMISNTNKFNKYKKLINRKQEEIDEVQKLINREIIENINLEKNEMVELYDNEKEKIKKQIGTLEHDSECYQHIYNKLYRTNVRKFFILFIFYSFYSFILMNFHLFLLKEFKKN